MKGPSYPSPSSTGAAQTASNQSTAISQQLMNMVNQQTPYGSLNYNNTGTRSYFDPSLGKTVELPAFTATTKLTPAQQGLLNQQQMFDKKFNTIGLQQADSIGNLLKTPFNYDPSVHNEWAGGLYDEISGENNARNSEQMDAKLAGMGLSPGSAAYNAEQSRLARDQSHSRNQFMLDSYNTGLNTAQVNRNQPINEISALMGGGQVQNPQFQNTSSVGMNGVDMAGLINNQYQAKNNQFQAQQGGLFGLGSAALGGWAMSDKRAKKDIAKVGKLNDGTGIYAYKYKEENGGGLMQLGVLAQEAKKTHPDAVKRGDDGYLRVDYSRIAEELAA